MKRMKTVLRLLLAAVLLITSVCIGLGQSTYQFELPASGNAGSMAVSPAITFYAPETIYLAPDTTAASAFLYYVDSDTAGNLNNNKSKTSGSVYFNCSQATAVSISCSGASVTMGAFSGTTTINTTVTGGNLNTGIPQGTTATITWTAQYTVNGQAKTAKAYTVCYAPFTEPVATSIRTYNNDGGYLSPEYVADLQGWAYISGVQGYGSGGNYKANASGSYSITPLLGTVTPPVGDVACNAWFTAFSGGGTYYTSHAQGNDYFTSLQNSPVGTLIVDTSRYTNLNQIPNLTCGFALTFLKNMDRINWYVSDFNANNPGWHYANMTSVVNAEQNTIFRDTEYPVIFAGSNTVIPELSTGIKLADSNVWSQSITGTGTQLMRMKAAAWAQNTDEWNCIVMLVNTNVTKVNKETLRNDVRYYTNLGLQASDHPADSEDFAVFETELKAAAERLGNPLNTDTGNSLSAQFAKLNRFSVQFDANGGTGAPGAQTKEFNINMFLSSQVPQRPYQVAFNVNGGDELPTAIKTVQSIFNGWNTAIDASGSSFAAGAVYSLEGDKTLYAQWSDPQAGTLPEPTRQGYTFAGWFTEDAGGTQVTSETDIESDIELYAKWLRNYQVLFDANGGAGAPDSQIKLEDIPLTLRLTTPADPIIYEIIFNANGGETTIPASKTVSCSFNSWNTLADGSGTSYSVGAEYTVNEPATLFAQWMNPQAGVLPEPVRSGYTFLGWYTQTQDGTEITGDTIIAEDIEIFAHWDVRAITNLVFASGVIKTEYFVGDTLDSTGLSVTASYDNGEVETVSAGFVCSPSSLKKAGSQRIAVTFEGRMIFFDVNVAPVLLTGISINTPPSKTVYNKGEEFRLDGMTLSTLYNNGSTRIIASGFTANYNFDSAGEKTVIISYTENGIIGNASVVVNVIENNIVYADTAPVTAGETLTLPVKITANEGLMGYSINIHYDSAVFTPVAVLAGTAFASGTLNDSIETAQPGSFKALWTGSEDVLSDGTMFTLTFSVNANAVGNQTITLTYDQADTFNENWDDVILNCRDIIVEVDNPAYVDPPVLSSDLVTATAGTNVNVPVHVTDSGGMTQFKISLAYDSSVFNFVSASNGSALLTGNIAYTESNGVLTVTWAGSLNDGEIFSVNFAVAQYKQGQFELGLSYDPGGTVFGNAATAMLCEDIEVAVSNPSAGESAWVQPDSTITLAGMVINVPVKIYNNQGIMGFGIFVNYDASVLTPLSVARGTVTGGGMFDSTMGPTSNGAFKVVWSDTGDVSSNGTVFTISFSVDPDAVAGDYPIGISYSQEDTFNEGWNDVILDCRSSNVTVDDAVMIIIPAHGSTTVINRENNSICGLQIGVLSLDGYVTVKEGYEINYVPTPNGFGTGTVVHISLGGVTIESYTIIVFGDVNGDGSVDSIDAGAMVDYENYLINWDLPADSPYKQAGDLNGDGKIDSIDAGIAVDAENYLLIIDQTTGLAVPV